MKTFFLWLVDIITWKSCVYDGVSNSTNVLTLSDNKCIDTAAKNECIGSGGRCQIDIDGYYIEVAVNVVYGIVWYQWGKRVLEHLQSLDRKEWHVLSSQSDEESLEATVPLEDVKIKGF